MIFQNIDNVLSNKIEKKFFIEKINIINELISKYCLKNEIEYNEVLSDIEISIKELKLIGIIKNKEELEKVKKVLGHKEYNRLIKSLTFYNKNKKQTEYLLKNFYNSYRKKQQQITDNKKNPKIVDLFFFQMIQYVKYMYHWIFTILRYTKRSIPNMPVRTFA
jgi:hypothetical protein